MRITITVANIGSVASAVTVTIGGLPCTDALWVDSATITCVAPAGAGEKLVPVVGIGGRLSALGT